MAEAITIEAPAAQRRRALLDGPIGATLLWFAAPNMLVMIVQTGVQIAETYFVGRLGTEPLAGLSLVFPLVALMQMMSNGAIGGGVSAAIARALGAGRREEAEALAVHAILIALGFGLVFTALVLGFGPRLYAAIGGEGGTLAAALAYSNVVFAGIAALWLMSISASILRGCGNMLVPAVATCVGAAAAVALYPLLVFGIGPLPALGIAGAGYALVSHYAGVSATVLWYLFAGRGEIALRPGAVPIRLRYFADILRVGAPSALNTILATLTLVAMTGFVSRFGPAAIAGYGIGARLEYLLIPIVFGIGAALVTMVGTNMGAGQSARARRTAWTGALGAAAITQTIGVAAALFPQVWAGFFSADPAVHAACRAYLQIVGPVYGAFGLGMALYFASQGAGRMLWPLTGGAARLVVAVSGGFLALNWLDAGLRGVFGALALALVVFGAINAAAVAARGWAEPRRRGA